jgi:hypothetical protein
MRERKIDCLCPKLWTMCIGQCTSPLAVKPFPCLANWEAPGFATSNRINTCRGG